MVIKPTADTRKLFFYFPSSQVQPNLSWPVDDVQMRRDVIVLQAQVEASVRLEEKAVAKPAYPW